jgi:hypothetical protein
LSKLDIKHSWPVTHDDIAALVGIGGGETRTAPYTGTKALMLAVLEDAIRAYLSHEPRARAEAEQWVLSRQRRSVFSFAVVCETLSLEPKAVRGALRRLRAQEISPDRIPRSRPNARRRSGIARDPGPGG